MPNLFPTLEEPLVGNYIIGFQYDSYNNIEYIQKTTPEGDKSWRKFVSYDGYGNISTISEWQLL